MPRTKTYDERFPPKDSGSMIESTETDDGKPEVEGERLLTREEVARKLGVSPRTIYDMEKRGVLPAPVKLGGIWVRHPASTIEAYIEKLKREAKA